VAEKVAKFSSIVCTVIFALSFIAAIVLGILSFGVSIIAIPSAIGLLVFVFPAISRIISVALEYQSKENTDSRRIVNVYRQRKNALQASLREANLFKLFKQAYPEIDEKDSVLRRDLNDKLQMYFPQIKATVNDDTITFGS
jgi:ABC-type transport system involved in cytochrome bd biosynthesis fused ATPase/permease subunit